MERRRHRTDLVQNFLGSCADFVVPPLRPAAAAAAAPRRLACRCRLYQPHSASPNNSRSARFPLSTSISGVCSLKLRASASAPASRRALTTSTCPPRAAQCCEGGRREWPRQGREPLSARQAKGSGCAATLWLLC